MLRRGAALQEALGAADAERVVAAAGSLVGLGEGSTPAGDDYLVGVLHALTGGRPSPPRDRIVAALGRVGHGRTTAVSADWLAAAARGEPSPVWRTLLRAFASGDGLAVEIAARAVRATGHTSGAFSLRGFLDTHRGGPQRSRLPL